MSFENQAPAADPRALAGAAALGSLVGLAVGVAYLAGGLARHASDQAPPTLAAEARPAALSIASALDAPRLAPRLSAPNAPAPTVIAAISPAPTVKYALPAPEPRPAPHIHMPFHFASFVASPFHLRAALESNRDVECLSQAVYYEARGEPEAGQEAVAQVVLNRVRHPAFPKSVCGVVFQHAGAGCQFSFACDGRSSQRRESGAWRHAHEVAERAMGGFVMAQVGEATHFHVSHTGASWAGGLLKVAQIGAHAFYSFAGRAGRPSMFHAAPEPSAPTAGQLTLAAYAAPKPPVSAVRPAEPAPTVVAAAPVADASSHPAAKAEAPQAKASEPAEAHATASAPKPSADPVKASATQAS